MKPHQKSLPIASFRLRKIQIKQAGDLMVKVSAKDSSDWKAINLNSIQLTPAN